MIAALLASGAPIDGFGVGTDMIVSADAPAFDIAYKLTEYAGEGRMKLSTGSARCRARNRFFVGSKMSWRVAIRSVGAAKRSQDHNCWCRA